MAFDPKTIHALAHLRLASRTGLGLEGSVREAFDQLDNACVFAALDEQTGYDVDSDHDRREASVTIGYPVAGDQPEDETCMDEATRPGWINATVDCDCDPVRTIDHYTIKTPWHHAITCPLYAPAPE